MSRTIHCSHLIYRDLDPEQRIKIYRVRCQIDFDDQKIWMASAGPYPRGATILRHSVRAPDTSGRREKIANHDALYLGTDWGEVGEPDVEVFVVEETY